MLDSAIPSGLINHTQRKQISSRRHNPKSLHQSSHPITQKNPQQPRRQTQKQTTKFYTHAPAPTQAHNPAHSQAYIPAHTQAQDHHPLPPVARPPAPPRYRRPAPTGRRSSLYFRAAGSRRTRRRRREYDLGNNYLIFCGVSHCCERMMES